MLLLIVPASLFAQPWRDRGPRDRYRYFADNTFEITLFAGYTWGGTVYSGQTSLFNQDADVASSANFGMNLGIPIQPNGMKVELMVDHQSTDFTNGNGGGLFDPSHRLGNFDITYYHAGILVPFNQSYACDAVLHRQRRRGHARSAQIGCYDGDALLRIGRRRREGSDPESCRDPRRDSRLLHLAPERHDLPAVQLHVQPRSVPGPGEHRVCISSSEGVGVGSREWEG